MANLSKQEYEQTEPYTILRRAYNAFDPRPLTGEALKQYYVPEVHEEVLADIEFTIEKNDHSKKMLVIGHRGCGKSTLLHKLQENLEGKYHTVHFDAKQVLNYEDVDVLDLLIMINLHLVNSIKEEKLRSNPLAKFKKLLEGAWENTNLDTATAKLTEAVTIKVKYEDKSRAAVRKILDREVEQLQDSIYAAVAAVKEQANKKLLVIIDNLDKLESKFAKIIFIKGAGLLTSLPFRMIFTFPLETYYDKEFRQKIYKSAFEAMFISLVPLKTFQGDVYEEGFRLLEKVLWKRLASAFVAQGAPKLLAEASGGLMRDYMSLAQDAIKAAMMNQAAQVGAEHAQRAKAKLVQQNFKLFDAMKHGALLKQLMDTPHTRPSDEELMELLYYLFFLEYKDKEDNVWYAPHPCLAANIDRYKLDNK